MEFASPAALSIHLKNVVRNTPFAMSNALNDMAFDARKHMQTKGLDSALDIKRNYTRKGIKVNKSTKRTLSASMGSQDWYVERQVTGEDVSKPKLFTPVTKSNTKFSGTSLRTKTGALKKPRANVKKKPFPITKNGRILLVKRKTKKRRPLVYLGSYNKINQYDKKLDWETHSTMLSDSDVTEIFKKQLERALLSSK